uniref:Uncharacterized protein n=1 Tax=Cannabis sativa TaxID=3483 RepID=A0A803RBY9_CANSA
MHGTQALMAHGSNDILQKLKKISSSTTHFYDSVLKLVPFSQKQVGIRIEARKSPSTEGKFNPRVDEESHNFLSRVFKFGRSQPKLVLDRSTIPPDDRTTICGVVLGHDSICRRPPVEGRKRCADHKGMRVKGTVKVEISNGNVYPQFDRAAPYSSNEDSKGVTGYSQLSYQ